MLTMAIVGPTGVEASMQMIVPTRAQEQEMEAEQIITLLKLLNIRIAERAGKVIKAEMRSAPTIFMAITIITPVTEASMVL